jgi:hypothetical protein
VRVRVEHITCPAGLACAVTSGGPASVDPAAGPQGSS